VFSGADGQGAAVVKVSGVVIMIVMLTAPGVLLAADGWRGEPNSGFMAHWFGVYPTDIDTKLAVYASSGLGANPVNLDNDLERKSSASALFASLNWLIGSGGAYQGDDIGNPGEAADMTLFLTDSGVRWKPFRKLGLALNYALFPADNEYSNDSMDTELDLDYMGPRLSFDIAF